MRSNEAISRSRQRVNDLKVRRRLVCKESDLVHSERWSRWEARVDNHITVEQGLFAIDVYTNAIEHEKLA
jgi:hypothetical protein